MSELLARIGWSQRYLADHLGVTEKTISNWVKSGNPPVYVMRYLELVAKLINV